MPSSEWQQQRVLELSISHQVSHPMLSLHAMLQVLMQQAWKLCATWKAALRWRGFFLLHATLTFTIKEEMLIGSYMAYWGEGFGKWRKQEIPKSTLLQCQAGTHTVKYLLAVMWVGNNLLWSFKLFLSAKALQRKLQWTHRTGSNQPKSPSHSSARVHFAQYMVLTMGPRPVFT